MNEKYETPLRGSIDAKIHAKKGLRLGDDKINESEKELYESILGERGMILANTDEELSKDFHNLLDDVADISEMDQFYLSEVARIFGIPLQNKGNALQMNYHLFQKILQFQAKHKMALTGIVDKILYEKVHETLSKDRTVTKSVENNAPAKSQTTSKPRKEEHTPKPESSHEKLDSTTNITTLPSGLQIARGPKNTPHPLISQGKMADMIITYEGPGGERQPDIGNTFDLGGGINSGGPELERKYAFGDNYTLWNNNFIPKEEVKSAVERTLEARIARTYTSCKKRDIDFDSLPLFAQKVLVDLHYNMESIQDGFPKFWQAIKEKKWKEAGKQLMDSGTGSPNNYLNDVYSRAYANAMMLTHENPDGAEKYKNEASEVLKGTHNAYLLYNEYFKTGKYGDHIGRSEVRHILEETKDPTMLASIILSDDVLRADKKSTATIQGILKKYVGENSANKDILIGEFRKRFGNFTEPLDSGEKVGSYQIYVSMTTPERFKKDLVYIDGEYGQKTQEAFFHDAFVVGNWGEKIEGGSGILKKSPKEIQKFTDNLGSFEKKILSHHYQSHLNISPDSSAEDIKKAQLVILLSGKEVVVDGKWNQTLEELLGYSEAAKKLAKFVKEKYGKYSSGKNSCGASVGNMLTAFGIDGLPHTGRDGENWNEILDSLVPRQFIKIKIDDPSQARPGGIVCYDDGGKGGAAVKYGHVEVKGTDGAYYHYLRSEKWGGSRGESVSNSHFTGYVYYPRNIT